MDESKDDTDGFISKDKDTLPKICIPLQSTSELCDSGDYWRAWSCIILAYLLRNTTLSLSEKTTNTSSKEGESQDIQHYRRGDLKQRGRYLTRRPGKYFWKKVKNVTGVFTSDHDVLMY